MADFFFFGRLTRLALALRAFISAWGFGGISCIRRRFSSSRLKGFDSRMDLSVTGDATPFRATDIKIKRARQHIAELEAVAAAYFASKPTKIETEIVGRTVKFHFEHRGVPDVVSAIIGDLIHNLRTSLDLLACEICRDAEASFPFSKREETLADTIKSTHFDKAGEAAIRLIWELKPYVGGNAQLRAIHDLDIQDKHRAIIPNATSIAMPIVDTWEWRIVGDPTQPTDHTLVFPAGSVFGEADLIKTLHDLVELTASVIEAFKALSLPAG